MTKVRSYTARATPQTHATVSLVFKNNNNQKQTTNPVHTAWSWTWSLRLCGIQLRFSATAAKRNERKPNLHRNLPAFLGLFEESSLRAAVQGTIDLFFAEPGVTVRK